MSTRFLLPSFLVLVLVASGCLDGSKAPEIGAEATILEVEPGVFLASDRAGLRGRVTNDAGLPVPGARVAVIGTESFGDTDGNGAFVFLNVTVGDVVLRTEAGGYTADERQIQLAPGNITTVEILLLPDVARGAGYRPHVHDHWAGRLEHTLLDADVQVHQENSDLPRIHPAVSDVTRQYAMNSDSSSSIFRIPVPAGDDHPNLIYPGAKEVHVTLVWDLQDCSLDKLGLKYRTAAGTDLKVLAPRASGTAFVIPVKADEWDSGHQRVTFWDFYVHPANQASAVGSWKPGLLLGPVHVKIVVFKGDQLPVEPAHEDFWGDATRLVLRSRDYAPLTTGNTMQRRDMMLDNVIVPPGATKMRMELWWNYAAANGTLPTADYVLTWRTGDMSRESPILTYVKAAEKHRDRQYVVYEIVLKPEETDAFYQKRSNWRWAPALKDHEDKEFFPDGARVRTYQLQVTVFRDSTAPVEE